jgi:hypothetical protein
LREGAAPTQILHGGYEREKIMQDGVLTRVELPRSRLGFALDRNTNSISRSCVILYEPRESSASLRPTFSTLRDPATSEFWAHLLRIS